MIEYNYQPDASLAAEAVADRLSSELSNEANRSVVWMLCGGSNIPLCVQIMDRLISEGSQLTSKLTVLLTDERYGQYGHADSNWKQLYDQGFRAGNARIIETLQAEKTLQDTVEDYAAQLQEILPAADVVVAQFGIGGDGHIAGILPQSSGLGRGEDSAASGEVSWVAGYDAGVFQRITITPPVWQHIDVAYALVYGDGKFEALSKLKNQDVAVADQPAQLLKQLPEAHIYTDQKL